MVCSKKQLNISCEKSSKKHQQHKHSGEIQFNEPRWSQPRQWAGTAAHIWTAVSQSSPAPKSTIQLDELNNKPSSQLLYDTF